MKISPTEKQKKFMDWEFGVFFHFGIRTFNHGHRDWDNVEMKPETFLPTELDCGQWIRSIKAVGAKYAVLTAKHHDWQKQAFSVGVLYPFPERPEETEEF